MKKKRLLELSLFTIVLTIAAIKPTNIFAATVSIIGGTNGPLCNSGGYFTPSTVTVTSGDTITFSVPSNDPYAGGVQINGFPQGSFVVQRGDSVTTDALTADVSYQGTWPNSPSCIKGSGTITVQAAPSSPLPPSTPPSSGSSAPPSNSSPSTTSVPVSSSSTSNTKTTAPTSQPIATPETVVVDTITVSGKKVTSMGDLILSQSQSLTLTGTTVPNGKITLTVHSSPMTFSVQADRSGSWSYTVPRLRTGSHTVYATVTDPLTGRTSALSKLLAFTVEAPPVATAAHPTTTPTKKAVSLLLPLGIIIVLLGVCVVAPVVSRRRRRSGMDTSVVSTTAQSLDTQLAPSNEEQPALDDIGTRPSTQTLPSPEEESNESRQGRE